MHSLLLSAPSLLSFHLLAAAAVPTGAGPDKPADIYGGEVAKTCQFPSTLYNKEVGCSGTLVHPRVVIHAGHCGKPSEFLMAEDGDSPARRLSTKWCETTDFDVSDYAICVLNEPVTDVPIAPIIQGCEVDELVPGAEITLSGFGNSNNAGSGKGFGVKRFVQVQINSLSATEALIGGMDGKGGCNGDSGGPAFIQLKDGTWRTFGATHGGDMHPNCAEGSWKLTHVAMPWYEEQLQNHGETDIDLSPCFDDQGNWDPTDECGGYAKDIAGPYGTWQDGCSDGAPLGGPSMTCAPPDEVEPEVRIDAPDNKDMFDEGDDVEVKVTASDDVALATVELLVDAQSQGVAMGPPFAWTLTGLEVGQHELIAVAVDTSNNMATSMPVQIDVVAQDDTSDTSSISDTSSQDSSSSGESSVSNSQSSDDSSQGASDETDKSSGATQSGDDVSASVSDNSSGDPGTNADTGGCSCSTQGKAGWTAFFAVALLGHVGQDGRKRRRQHRVV